MASTLEEEHVEFYSIKDERDYWKKKYFKLKRQQLIDNEDQYPERKRVKLENQVPTDPLKLPEPCVQSILKYLSGMEVIKILSVSKYWRDYLHSRSALMNRVTDEIVIVPPENITQQEVDNFCDNSTRRGYKHMKAPFILHQDFVKAINPIELHASTLETLEIKDDYLSYKYFENYILASTDFGSIKIDPCVFPKLQKLEIPATDWEIDELFLHLQPHSFPVLTHLKIELRYINGYGDLKNHLFKFPKLKTLQLSDSFSDDDDASLQVERDPNLPKLQNIYIPYFHKEMIQDQRNSLVKFECESMSFEDLGWIIQECKSLKSLTIGRLAMYKTEDMEIFSENKSIDVLKIGRFYIENSNDRLLPCFQSLLLALPSLSKFTLFENIPGEIIQFMASNMARLKKFTCKTFNEQYQQALEQVRSNPEKYINTTFEIVIAIDTTKCSLFEIEKEFE